MALYTQKNFVDNWNVKGIVGHAIRICSATVSWRNKVFIIYEYLSETREKRIVVVSFSSLRNNLMTFFRKFSAKKFNPIVVMQWLRTQLTSKYSNWKYNCVLEICVVIDCALVIFTSRYNENILFERKHYRFLVVGNLSLKWAAQLVFLRQRLSRLRLAEVGVTKLRINISRNLQNPIFFVKEQ